MVMMMVVAMVMMARNSHHAFRAADNTAGHSTDNATDRRANRTGRAPALGRASLTAPHNALSVCGERHRKKGKNADGYSQSGFHGQTPCLGVLQSPPRSRGLFASHGWRRRASPRAATSRGVSEIGLPDARSLRSSLDQLLGPGKRTMTAFPSMQAEEWQKREDTPDEIHKDSAHVSSRFQTKRTENKWLPVKFLGRGRFELRHYRRANRLCL
jgi:hypothetical protein